GKLESHAASLAKPEHFVGGLYDCAREPRAQLSTTRAEFLALLRKFLGRAKLASQVNLGGELRVRAVATSLLKPGILADVFEHFAVGNPGGCCFLRNGPFAGPGLRVRARIVNSEFVRQRFEVWTRDAFDQ